MKMGIRGSERGRITNNIYYKAHLLYKPAWYRKREFNSAREESRVRYDEASNTLITLCEWATRTCDVSKAQISLYGYMTEWKGMNGEH